MSTAVSSKPSAMRSPRSSPAIFVAGGFNPCDNTCAACRKGATANCLNAAHYEGCQAERLRVPLADGTLIATPEMPADDLIPSILALSDVMCTGWHAAVSAGVGPGKSVAVVGDGAVGLCAVLAAVQLGAPVVIAMSRHESRPEGRHRVRCDAHRRRARR